MLNASVNPKSAEQRKATLVKHGIWLKALDPKTVEIDGRTVEECLSFVASYASLINYYDLQNRQNSNWSGFLLKDPTILMAAISQTLFASSHEQFSYLEQRISFLTKHPSDNSNQHPAPALNEAFNQLFDLTFNLFIDINRWLVHLNANHHQYPLRKYICKKAVTDLSPLLAQFLRLQKDLSSKSNDIDEPDYYLVNNFEYQLKMEGSFTTLPATNAVGGQGSVGLNSTKADLQPLQEASAELGEIFQQVFSFYVQVIDQAKHEFTKLQIQGKGYPDTSLLIAFCRLMEVQRQQLNGVAERHLDFYYKDILKQEIQGASPDQVYLSVHLVKKAESLTLLAGTEFVTKATNGKPPQVFSSSKDQALNRIEITQVRTLFYDNRSNSSSTSERANQKVQKQPRPNLYLRQIDKPSQQSKNQQGDVLSWPLLGAAPGLDRSALAPGKLSELQQGFAFASPMLFLQGGTRTIIIAFTFAKQVTVEPFKNSVVYLSSTKQWLEINKPKIVWAADKEVLTLTITLQPSDMPVLPLADKVLTPASPWPLFKLILSDGFDLSQPPDLTGIDITTKVCDFKEVDLYSGVTKLNTSNFTPFGSAAPVGANFNIVSNELSAKPINELTLFFNWENLPLSFESYYQSYNDYLKTYGSTDSEKDGSYFTRSAFTGAISIPNLIKSVDEASDAVIVRSSIGQFGLFTHLLDSKTKKSENSKNTEQGNPESPSLLRTFAKAFEHAFSKAFAKALGLFGFKGAFEAGIKAGVEAGGEADKKEINEQARLRSTREFLLLPSKEGDKQVTTADPQRLLMSQNQAATAANAFIQMQLATPSLGFGSELYPKVTADVAYTNAQIIICQSQSKLLKSSFCKDLKKKTIAAMPNKPFVPKVSSLSINYTAAISYDLAAQAETVAYPFEFFHCGSFAQYQVYNANRTIAGTAITQTPLNPSHTSPPQTKPAKTKETPASQDELPGQVALYSGAVEGTLYLALNNVVAPCTLSILFDLAQTSLSSKRKPNKPQACFSYLSDTGWRPLTVLSDGTQGFGQPGVIEVQIDEDISNQSVLMDGDDYWLAVSAKKDVQRFANVVLLDTQIVQVHRCDTSAEAPPQLAPGAITSALNPQPLIASIAQPVASSGGKPAESKDEFYQRVSGRIKSKNRACSADDYVQLVLQQFPQIYFASCGKYLENPDNSRRVKLALVIAYPNSSEANAFRPAADVGLLGDVESFIKARAPAYVGLNVVNMRHQTVLVKTALTFSDPSSVKQSIENVNQQLRLFLSPWVDSKQVQREISKTLNSEKIVDFLLTLTEVAAVNSLSCEGICNNNSGDFRLLVSAEQHCITQYVAPVEVKQ